MTTEELVNATAAAPEIVVKTPIAEVSEEKVAEQGVKRGLEAVEALSSDEEDADYEEGDSELEDDEELEGEEAEDEEAVDDEKEEIEELAVEEELTVEELTEILKESGLNLLPSELSTKILRGGKKIATPLDAEDINEAAAELAEPEKTAEVL